MTDKRGILARPGGVEQAIIELGCGPGKRYPGSIGIDVIDHEAVDIVGDALEVQRALPASTARLVTSSHFLEHVTDPGVMLDAMTRLLAPGGEIEIIVPHFSNPYYHSDPTHVCKVGFGLYTMSYYARDAVFRRQVPGYVRRDSLTLKRVDLCFKSTPPFYGRHAIKRLIGPIFNSCRFLQELWEENLCYMFPCYEIRYVLGRTSDVEPSRR